MTAVNNGPISTGVGGTITAYPGGSLTAGGVGGLTAIAALLAGGGGGGGGATFKSLGLLGANATGANAILSNRLYTNAFYNGARLTKTAQYGVNCARDATTGWPTEAFYVCLTQGISNGSQTLDTAMPAGTYNWSYSYLTAGGTTTLTMAASGNNIPTNIGVSGFTLNAATVTGSISTCTFSFTIAAGGTATLSFDGPVTFVDCPLDGLATAVGQPLFRSEALAYYAQYGVLRTLDFTQANSRADTTWASRPVDYTGPQLAQDVPSWERTWAFVSAVKSYPGSKLKEWMLNLPVFADDSYAGNLATLFTSIGVPANFASIEYGNEPWNSAASDRYHSYENLSMASANGIANYQVVTNSSGTITGPGQVLSSMSVDTSGLCTVTLTVTCASLLDSVGSPYIVNGATALIAATTALFNKSSSTTPDINQVVTISGVTGSTFQYSTGVSGAGSSAPGLTAIFFKPTATLLASNTTFTVAEMQKRWSVYRTFAAQAGWRTVRSRAAYGEKFYLNIQPFGTGGQAANKYPTREYLYSSFLGGGSMSWLDAVAMANYSAPAGTVAALDDLFNPVMATSLYAALNGSANLGSVDNHARAFVYQCTLNQVAPWSYEGGIALQTASSSGFAVAAATDPRTETYLTAHMDVVLKNGVRRYMNYHNSPRIVINGSNGNSAWQSLQYLTDSINAGDSNYSARRAAQDKYATLASYSNINGSDLTTLDIGTYQSATDLTGTSGSLGINGTNGALYWNSSTGLDRSVDWVYAVNSLTSRQIFVDGTDSQATAVKVYAYQPDLSAPVLLGTIHLAVNGVTSSGTGSTTSPCLDPITWTPPLAGQYVIRLRLDAGTGTGPGIRRVRFV